MSILNISIGMFCFVLAVINFRARRKNKQLNDDDMVKKGTIIIVACLSAGVLLISVGALW